MTKWSISISVGIAVFLVGGSIGSAGPADAAAQSARAKTTLDGVFSDALAARGQSVYDMNCSSCHGPALEGTGQAPALADSDFAKEWQGQPLSDLFERIHTTMPADAPGSLKDADVADVLAFILKKGNHPSGTSELPSDTGVLKAIAFSAKTPAAR
jgi:mono/diheme cytochrome c family protein